MVGSFFNPKRDGLQYHRVESELRLIESSVRTLLKSWLKKDDNKAVLESALQANLEKDSEVFKKLPSYIQKVLTAPRELLPSLNPKISDAQISEKVIQVMKEHVLELHDENNEEKRLDF